MCSSDLFHNSRDRGVCTVFGEEAAYDLGRRGDLPRQLGFAHAHVDTRLVERTDDPVDGAELSTRALVARRELRSFHLLVEELVEARLASRRMLGTVAFKLRKAPESSLATERLVARHGSCTSPISPVR